MDVEATGALVDDDKGSCGEDVDEAITGFAGPAGCTFLSFDGEESVVVGNVEVEVARFEVSLRPASCDTTTVPFSSRLAISIGCAGGDIGKWLISVCVGFSPAPDCGADAIGRLNVGELQAYGGLRRATDGKDYL